MEEAFPEAAAVLREAGWKPHDEWGVYTHGTLVMGSPREGDFHVKNTVRCADSPDTPDDPVLAAHWLVARFPVAEASEPDHDSLTAENAGDGGDHVADLTASEDHDPEAVPDQVEALAQDDSVEPEAFEQLETLDASEPREPEASFMELGSEILDADYTEPTDPPPEDHPSGAFIFGDNLEQKRTAAIGLVVQAALERMPEAIDYALMAELRNFAMGVSEGHWANDPAQQAALEALEATEALRRAVEVSRDEKVAVLLNATREEIEAFDPEAGWP
jgi:hypothetical protein